MSSRSTRARSARTPRSNPATYTGLFTGLRELFEAVPEARAPRLRRRPIQFSTSRGGRLRGLPGRWRAARRDAFPARRLRAPADVCKGPALQPRNARDPLGAARTSTKCSRWTVDDALRFFQHIPTIQPKLQTLVDVGLAYLRLGPECDHALWRRSAAREARPRAGQARHRPHALHPRRTHDPACTSTTCSSCCRCCIACATRANTLVVIEHNLDVIKTADWVIDLGPEGGARGRRHHRHRHARAGRGYTRLLHRPLPARRVRPAAHRDARTFASQRSVTRCLAVP